MNFRFAQESDGTPEQVTDAPGQLAQTRIAQNREAKRTTAKLNGQWKKGKSCECGGSLHEDGVETVAAAINRAPATKPNDRKVSSYKGFEIHCVYNEDGTMASYYAKHRTLGNAGHTQDIASLKALIDRTVAKNPQSPLFQSADAAKESAGTFVIPNSAGEPLVEKQPKLGSGGRFAALKSKLGKRPGVTDPGALAAAIGRKKYGAKSFAKLSAGGR